MTGPILGSELSRPRTELAKSICLPYLMLCRISVRAMFASAEEKRQPSNSCEASGSIGLPHEASRLKCGRTNPRISRELRGLREWAHQGFFNAPIRVIRVIRG